MQKIIIINCGLMMVLASIWLYYIDKSYMHFEIPIYELEKEIGDIDNAEFLIARYPNNTEVRSIVTAIYRNGYVKNFVGISQWNEYLPLDTSVDIFKYKEIESGERWRLRQTEYCYISNVIKRVINNDETKEIFFQDGNCIAFYYEGKCYWYPSDRYEDISEFSVYLDDIFGKTFKHRWMW